MVIRRGRSVTALGALLAFGGALAAACSGDGGEPVDLAPSISVDTGDGTIDDVGSADAEQGSLLGDQPAVDARPIVAGNGEYPVSEVHRAQSALPPAVQIGSGRIWVPWPPYPEADLDAGQGSRPVVAGSRSELLGDVGRGHDYVVAQRTQWEAMPPYLPAARTALSEGARVASRRGGTESAWELVVDPAELGHETRLNADRSAAYDHVALCPPHPTPGALGVDPGSTDAERDRASAAIEAFIIGMRSPGGRPMHSWGTTVNDIAKLLVYSPGEPMELALGGHSLADVGFFPGDWSVQAKRWLTRRAAQGAVTDSLVGHAAVSTGPATLWEACSDLATIIPGVYSESHRTRQLESLWARGLRLEFTAPPVERAWVADLSAAGHALAVICHPPGQSFLVDASTGERLDAGTSHRPQVEAMWLTWSRLSYRVLRNALFEGSCDSAAFSRATQWLHDEKAAHAATLDWSEPRAWGSGVRNQWVAVRAWIDVSQAEAWQAHRDHGWHLAFWCQTGIPLGALVDGELQRPAVADRCTPAQWAALSQAAASAPVVDWELSATQWTPGVSWHERMYLSPFKSLEQILGCLPDTEATAAASRRQSGLPAQQRPKRPWPPGSLPLTPDGHGYPRPMPPCPDAGWPPQSDRFWWPEAEALAEVSDGSRAGTRAGESADEPGGMVS
jgi:hypothetical protein